MDLSYLPLSGGMRHCAFRKYRDCIDTLAVVAKSEAIGVDAWHPTLLVVQRGGRMAREVCLFLGFKRAKIAAKNKSGYLSQIHRHSPDKKQEAAGSNKVREGGKSRVLALLPVDILVPYLGMILGHPIGHGIKWPILVCRNSNLSENFLLLIL